MPWLKMRLALALAGTAGPAVAVSACGSQQAAPPPIEAPAEPIGNTVEETEVERDPEPPPLVANQWCGTPAETTERFGDQGTGDECPTSIYESNYLWNPDYTAAEAWTDSMGTTHCCFLREHYKVQPKRGRPLVVGDVARTAAGVRGSVWAPASVVDVALADDLSPALRHEVASRWIDNGLIEHASVASFARATIELMAVGAPPSLISAVQAAAADEVRHAQMCFAIASIYAGAAVGPSALPPVAPRELDLVGLAVATFEEGCIPESIGTLEAEHIARRARSPRVRQIASEIAEDEARHAELAWATVGWAIRAGGQPVIDAIARSAEAYELPDEADATPIDDVLAAHGLLSDADRAELTRRGWREVIAPLVAEMA
jgi:hypothetical protein